MDNKKIITNILKSIDKIMSFIEDVKYESFELDGLLQDACFMNLMQIGENASKIDDDYIKKHSDIKWKEMKGLRNRIVHDYDGVNIMIVWNTMKEDLPILREQLSKLLDETK